MSQKEKSEQESFDASWYRALQDRINEVSSGVWRDEDGKLMNETVPVSFQFTDKGGWNWTLTSERLENGRMAGNGSIKIDEFYQFQGIFKDGLRHGRGQESISQHHPIGPTPVSSPPPPHPPVLSSPNASK
jgi:hypothetical protein